MNPVDRNLNRVSVKLGSINEYLGRALSWLTLGMVLMTFLIVLLRYFFNMGSVAMQESVSYMHAMVFMLGAAYTFKHEGHVRVDIFYRRFPPSTKALIDLTGCLIFLIPVSVFILYTSLDYVAAAWRIREASLETGGLAFAYLLKTVIPAMAVLLVLQAISCCLGRLVILMQHRDQKNDNCSPKGEQS